jgi:SAM-dependent methyltransferase
VRLKMPLPPDRTLAQLTNHYEVEKALAGRLRESSREDRKISYRPMYDDLFRQVPDHPRLMLRDDQESHAKEDRQKLKIVGRLINNSTIFLEFAPGDCLFSKQVSQLAKFVYGIDISDQRSKQITFPNNFKLIIYDGYDLELPSGSIDIVFSNELIEHFHPEDILYHFQLVHRILNKGGAYLFITPHKFAGPSDISMYFSEEPEGFHLKEWTYGEIAALLNISNYSLWNGYIELKGMFIKLPPVYFYIVEMIICRFPFNFRKFLARYLLRQICIIAVK